MAKPIDKKLKDAVEATYKLGYMKGQERTEERLEGRIENIKKYCQDRCNDFWEEILRLDTLEPVTGVVLKFEEVERLIKILKKNKSYWWARKLRYKLNRSFEKVEEVMKLLGEKVED